jgi:hypothetical protein
VPKPHLEQELGLTGVFLPRGGRSFL